MSRRRQQTAPGTGAVQDTSGVGGRACDEGRARNRRDPSPRTRSGRSVADKPSAKQRRAERESEGLVVPSRAATITPLEGRGPALTAAASGAAGEGMVQPGPNHPTDKVRELQRSLFGSAKKDRRRRLHAPFGGIAGSDVQAGSWRRMHRHERKGSRLRRERGGHPPRAAAGRDRHPRAAEHDPLPRAFACRLRTSSVSRVRENRTHGLTGGLR